MFLLSQANGSADEHFWISFSRENAGSVSIIRPAGGGWQTLGRVSWHNLEGLNFTRRDPETMVITTEAIPARNSGVSVGDW